jgi:hypothetical protein
MTDIVPIERIVQKIYIIKGRKIIIDSELANLYDVKTHVLNQAVKRNRERFPKDFMFQLSKKEYASLISQFVISKKGRGGRRKLPFVFTEHGVAMLSSVLNSKKAIEINIMIIRAFIKIRELLGTHKKLAMKIAQLETKYDEQFVIVFNALKHLMKEPEKKNIGHIGFRIQEAYNYENDN